MISCLGLTLWLVFTTAASAGALEMAPFSKLFDLDKSTAARPAQTGFRLVKPCETTAIVLYDKTASRARPFAPAAPVVSRYYSGDETCVVGSRETEAGTEPGKRRAYQVQGSAKNPPAWIDETAVYIKPQGADKPSPSPQRTERALEKISQAPRARPLRRPPKGTAPLLSFKHRLAPE